MRYHNSSVSWPRISTAALPSSLPVTCPTWLGGAKTSVSGSASLASLRRIVPAAGRPSASALTHADARFLRPAFHRLPIRASAANLIPDLGFQIGCRPWPLAQARCPGGREWRSACPAAGCQPTDSGCWLRRGGARSQSHPTRPGSWPETSARQKDRQIDDRRQNQEKRRPVHFLFHGPTSIGTIYCT